MNELRNNFITLYYNELVNSDMFVEMGNTSENSKHHREKNILTHTNMVISQYISMRGDKWDILDVCGAFACAFHDVGKPSTEELKSFNGEPDRNVYYGHELVSARMWEDWSMSNFSVLEKLFNITYFDIYRIGWTIENHLPFKITKKHKKYIIAKTVHKLYGCSGIFYDVLISDCLGRISDESRIDTVYDWIKDIENIDITPDNNDNDEKEVMFMVGASGSGKTTFVDNFTEIDKTIAVFSLDKLRLEWYGDNSLNDTEMYSYAYKKSVEDEDFMRKANRYYIDLLKSDVNWIIVDNTNTSKKSRRFYIDEAKRHDYITSAILFPMSINELYVRGLKRVDKNVNMSVIKTQYNNISYPSYGDFGYIDCVHNNE